MLRGCAQACVWCTAHAAMISEYRLHRACIVHNTFALSFHPPTTTTTNALFCFCHRAAGFCCAVPTAIEAPNRLFYSNAECATIYTTEIHTRKPAAHHQAPSYVMSRACAELAAWHRATPVPHTRKYTHTHIIHEENDTFAPMRVDVIRSHISASLPPVPCTLSIFPHHTLARALSINATCTPSHPLPTRDAPRSPACRTHCIISRAHARMRIRACTFCAGGW